MPKPRDGILDVMYDPKQRKAFHTRAVLAAVGLSLSILLAILGMYAIDHYFPTGGKEADVELEQRQRHRGTLEPRFASVRPPVLSCEWKGTVAAMPVHGRTTVLASPEEQEEGAGVLLRGTVTRLETATSYGLVVLGEDSAAWQEGQANVYNPTGEGRCRELGDLGSATTDMEGTLALERVYSSLPVSSLSGLLLVLYSPPRADCSSSSSSSSTSGSTAAPASIPIAAAVALCPLGHVATAGEAEAEAGETRSSPAAGGGRGVVEGRGGEADEEEGEGEQEGEGEHKGEQGPQQQYIMAMATSLSSALQPLAASSSSTPFPPASPSPDAASLSDAPFRWEEGQAAFDEAQEEEGDKEEREHGELSPRFSLPPSLIHAWAEQEQEGEPEPVPLAQQQQPWPRFQQAVAAAEEQAEEEEEPASSPSRRLVEEGSVADAADGFPNPFLASPSTEGDDNVVKDAMVLPRLSRLARGDEGAEGTAAERSESAPSSPPLFAGPPEPPPPLPHPPPPPMERPPPLPAAEEEQQEEEQAGVFLENGGHDSAFPSSLVALLHSSSSSSSSFSPSSSLVEGEGGAQSQGQQQQGHEDVREKRRQALLGRLQRLREVLSSASAPPHSPPFGEEAASPAALSEGEVAESSGEEGTQEGVRTEENPTRIGALLREVQAEEEEREERRLEAESEEKTMDGRQQQDESGPAENEAAPLVARARDVPSGPVPPPSLSALVVQEELSTRDTEESLLERGVKAEAEVEGTSPRGRHRSSRLSRTLGRRRGHHSRQGKPPQLLPWLDGRGGPL